MLKKTAIAVLLTVLIALVSCSPGASPTTLPIPLPWATPEPEPEPEPALTPITIFADKLYAEYDTNEVAANLKYKDKPLKVHGVVTEIAASQTTGNPVISIAESLEVQAVEYITAYLAADQDVKAAELSRGDRVRVLGICDGIGPVKLIAKDTYLYGVRLKDCVITD
jgi:biopolymer transport protein ExbD